MLTPCSNTYQKTETSITADPSSSQMRGTLCRILICGERARSLNSFGAELSRLEKKLTSSRATLQEVGCQYLYIGKIQLSPFLPKYPCACVLHSGNYGPPEGFNYEWGQFDPQVQVGCCFYLQS